MKKIIPYLPAIAIFCLFTIPSFMRFNSTLSELKDYENLNEKLASNMINEGFVGYFVEHPDLLPALREENGEIGFNKSYSQGDYDRSMAFIQSIPVIYTGKVVPMPKNLFDDGTGIIRKAKYSNKW